MKRFWSKITSLLSGSRPASPTPALSPQELDLRFKTQYHNLILLLAANNKALDLMAELEEALEGGALVGMSFIRARITALNVAVFQMVKHLCLLAPGKYDLLFERLGAI
ncbi:MAG: pyruvate, water dikinase, partial [Thermodesulfobacteriota bacterium]